MLVLSRREGQKIVFPGLGITCEVLRIKGSIARLGIQAPSDVKILREELTEHAPGGFSAAPDAQRDLAISRASQDASLSRPIHRALLVDDNANERELLASYLRISGFDVVTASDGAEALDYLASHERPDVVLLDMLMPRCDGAATVNVIRGTPSYQGTRIFAVSGTSPSTLGVPTGPKGVDRWFEKPLNPDALIREMNHLVDARGSA